MSNSIVMYTLSLSLCGYRTFRRVQDLNIIRWTILSNKIRNSYYNSGTNTAFNLVALPIIPEGLKYIRRLWKFLKSLTVYSYICGFFCVSVFRSGPRSDKFLMTVDTVLNSGVYHLLLSDYDCIKVRIEF